MSNIDEYTDLDGVRYIAVEKGGCRECAHFDPFEIATAGCRAAAECRPRFRADGRAVVWVTAEGESAS